MHPASQGESSSGPSLQPIKHRRSHPWNDPSLNQDSTPLVPPGFEGSKKYPTSADSTVGIDYIVGQAVSGVVESTFDGGCILSIKIGDSNKNLKSIVFKPGRYHVTAENDVAPRVQMIRSHDVHSLSERSQGLSRGHSRATKTTSTVPAKRKFGPYMAPSVPSMGVRGTVTPVILEPVNFSNSVPACREPLSDGSRTENVLAFVDKDLHLVEQISMFPRGQHIPVLANQTHPSGEVGSVQKYSGSFNYGTGTSQRDEGHPKVSDIDTSCSSQMLVVELRKSREVLESSAEDSGIASTPSIQIDNDPVLTDSLQWVSGTNAMFNFGSGRRTKLLPVRRGTKAVQENMNENLVQIAETTSGSKVEFHETRATEMEPKD